VARQGLESGYLPQLTKPKENPIDIPPNGAVPDSTGVPESTAPEDLAPGMGAPAGGVPMEPSVEAIRRLEGELDEFRDRHARLAAEFDNYRKRVNRENHVLVERAQAASTARTTFWSSGPRRRWPSMCWTC